MFYDIHTHIRPVAGQPAVYDVPWDEADGCFAAGAQGHYSVGVHPWRLEHFTAGRMEQLRIWAEDDRVVAIGECGLDKNIQVDLPVQVNVFGMQAALAEELSKPLIIHCVGCFNELFAIKKQWKPQQPWIIHGFRGKPQLAEQALRAGFCLSFGERFNAASVRATPLDCLFVETDESLLPIADIYRQVAAAKGCPPECLTAGRCFFHHKDVISGRSLPITN